MSNPSITLPPNLLKNLPLEQLRTISDNESSFYEYFSTLELEETTKIHNQREQLTNANRDISQQSLDLKPTFEEKKARLVESNLKAAELKEAYNVLYQKLNSLAKAFDRKAMLKDLRDLSNESEKESDDLTEQFLDKTTEMDFDSFIKTFMDSRITYWKRKVKADKMEELLKQNPVDQAPPTANWPPYNSSSTPSFPTATPYPPSHAPVQSLPPSHPYPPNQRQRNSLPTSSIPYSQPTPPSYATIQTSQPQYSMPPTYQQRGPPQARAPYPGGYPPSSGPRPPQPGYPPQNSYRPPPVGAPYGGGGYSYTQGRKY